MGSIAGDGGGGPRATVRRARLLEAPYLTWNAFVELLSTAAYEELTPIQCAAFLVFRYDSEVKNGGHERFFRHHGTERLAETLIALERLEAPGQRDLLETAGAAWDRTGVEELDQLDDEFHVLQPDLHVRLESWLESHLSEFIVLEG